MASAASSAKGLLVGGEVLARPGEGCAGVILAVEDGVGIDEAQPAGEIAAVAIEALGQAVDHLRDHAGAICGREPLGRRHIRGK